MSRFYCDPLYGLDSQDGLSWATAKRTPGAAEALCASASGDEVSIVKTPMLVTNVAGATVCLQWTDASSTVTLSNDAVTQTLTLSTGVWVASTNVTTSADTTNYKIGASASSIVVGITFTAGLAAYTPTGTTLTLSGYDGISFLFKPTVTTAAFTITAGNMSLLLCSDTAGATAVATLTIPYTMPVGAIAAAQKWMQINIWYGTNYPTVTLTSVLPNGVRSVALYVHNQLNATNPVTFLFTNLIAVSSTNGINHASLIGKNGTGEAGGWWGTKSIVGSTIVLGETQMIGTFITAPTMVTKYYGVTENVPGYSILPAITPGTGTSGGGLWQIAPLANTWTNQKSGASPDNPIKIIGGYNKITDTVDGITIFGGVNSLGAGLSTAGLSSYAATHVNYRNLWFTRYASAIVCNGAATSFDVQFDNCGAVVIGTDAITFVALSDYRLIKFWAHQTTTPGGIGNIRISGGADNIWFDQLYVNSGNTTQHIEPNSSNIYITNSVIQGAVASGMILLAGGAPAGPIRIYNTIFKNNAADIGTTTSSGACGAYEIELFNCALQSSTEVELPGSNPMSQYSYVASYNHDQTLGLIKRWGKFYSAVSDSTLTHTSGVSSLKYTPALISDNNNTASTRQIDLQLQPIKVSFKQGKMPATAAVWVYPNLGYQGGSINICRRCTPAFGDTSDVIMGTLTASVTISVWTGLTVTINPAIAYWNNNNNIDSILFLRLNSATPTTTSTVSGSINIGDFTKTDYSPLNSVISFG